MVLTLIAFVPILLAWLGQAPSVPASPPAEDELRATIRQYYDAQAARDPDRALAFWSANAAPRPTRDAFVAVFGAPAEDTFVVDVRALEIDGAAARARVAASRTRLLTRDGRPFTDRTTLLNSQLWRREAGGWRLLRDGPFADEIADDLIAAPPADRPSLYARNSRPDLVQARLAISQRATMAVTVAKSYARGRTLFELALDVSRASGDRHGEANSLHNIAQADYFLHDYDAAADAYGAELAVAREIDDPGAAAAAQFGLATVAYSRADYTPALGFYREALAIYERQDDGPSIGRAVVSIGNVQYLQGEYDAAAASYRRGLASAVAGGDAAGATYARRGLGRVFAAQGDVPAALDMYTRVLADARAALRGDPRTTADAGSALERIGELYFRVGNTERARAAFEEAKGFYAADPEGAGRVLGALGATELVAGRDDAALAAYGGSRARFDSARNPDGVARAWVGIGFSQAAREQFADAVAAYRAAIALFGQQNNNDGVARAWLGLSMAQSGGGDEAAALESAGKVAAIAEGLKSDELSWRAGVRAGEALRRLDRLADARRAFERAATTIERIAADAPVSAEARGELSDSASAWTGLAFTLAKQGDARGALDAMEARRAHIRRVDFAAFQHDIAPGATPEELADERSIVREIVSTRAQLRAESQAPRRDAARMARLEQRLAAMTARRSDQQARLYARVPQLALWRGLTWTALAPAAVADLVPGPSGLVVAYLVTDDELLAVSIARGGDGPDVVAAATPMNRRALADALAAAMQPAALHDVSEWRTRAAPLAAALLDPIAARLAGRDRVVVIPDALLWQVPFEALPAGDRDLASRAVVTYGTSLAALANAGRLAPLPARRAAGVVAAPVVPEAIRAQIEAMLPSWKAPDAAAAAAAAQLSAAAYGGTAAIRAGTDASETAVRTLVGSADVLHAQAPLQVSAAAPLLSSLLLASDGETPERDGRLEAREWFALNGRTRVMVLPDGSPFGAAGTGGAMDAIAWAASAAGVSTLVVGRWPADAFDADALAAAFHAQIATGASPVDAWRAAVSSMRDRGGAPSTWAGLRLIGG